MIERCVQRTADSDSSPRYCSDCFTHMQTHQTQQQIFHPEATSIVASLTVFVQPMSTIAQLTCICAHIQNPKHQQQYHCLDTCQLSGYMHIVWIHARRLRQTVAAQAAEKLKNGIHLPPPPLYKRLYYLNNNKNTEDMP